MTRGRSKHWGKQKSGLARTNQADVTTCAAPFVTEQSVIHSNSFLAGVLVEVWIILGAVSICICLIVVGVRREQRAQNVKQFLFELSRKSPLADDDREFRKTHCAKCGLIMPLYEAKEVTEERQIGRSSPAYRKSWFSGFGISSRGTARTWSGTRQSVSSGRTYYANRTIHLCLL